MGKQNARDVGTGLSVISAAGVITPEPITSALGIGGLLGQGTAFIIMGVVDSLKKCRVDIRNTGQIGNIKPVKFNQVKGKGILVDCINNSAVIGGWLIDTTRALEICLAKLRGAMKKKRKEQ